MAEPIAKNTLLIRLLESGIKELNLTNILYKSDVLLSYISLLVKWNKVYSLTAITAITDMITYHLLDGLTVLPYLDESKTIVDVGSGMGVPGVIIAICCPQIQVTVLDCNHKKTAFLKQVAIELRLDNLHVITSKVEEFSVADKFDLAVSRAFADTLLFIKLSKHLIRNDGIFIAMKSAKVWQEVEQINNDYIWECIRVDIPGVLDKRVLLKIKNNEEKHNCNS